MKEIRALYEKINEFQERETAWVKTIQDINESYMSDFSVMAKQNVIDMLHDFHTHKETVLMAILLFTRTTEDRAELLSSEKSHAISRINMWAAKIAELRFADAFLLYCDRINEAIAFFKTAEGQIYENRIAKADVIIKLWKNLLENMKDTSRYMKQIRIIVQSFLPPDRG